MNDLISRGDAIKAVLVSNLSACTVFGRSEEGMATAKELIQVIKNLPSAQPEPLTLRVNRELTKEEYDKLMQDIKDAPIVLLSSAQPELKTGKWTLGCDMPPMKHRNGKPKKFWPSLRYCSVCGHEAFDDSDWGEQLFEWCPYCGADMRGEGHE